MRGINRDTSGMDIRGTLSRCGYDLSLDPHAEKGTGLHGFNVGTGTGHLVKDSRFVLWVHDQPYGAAVQVQGVQNSKLYLDATDHVPGAATDRRKRGAALGSDTRDFDMSYLYGDALAGKAVATDGGLDSSNSNISVDYARSSNVRSARSTRQYTIMYGDVR